MTSLKIATENAIISSYLAGRSVRSLALEYGRTERSIKITIRRDAYARTELDRSPSA